MTTGATQDKLRRKALMYVFGKRVKKIVDVVEVHKSPTTHYRVRHEDPYNAGIYSIWTFNSSKEIEAEIADALYQLNWIADAKEFPQ